MLYTCPHCKATGAPVNHNNRGLRCPSCWEKLPAEVVADLPVTVPAEAGHVESQTGELATPKEASGAPIASDGESPMETRAEPEPEAEPEAPAKGKRKQAK